MLPLTKKRKNYIVNKNFAIYVKKEFIYDDKKSYKVRDHFHYTGNYRATAHV